MTNNFLQFCTYNIFIKKSSVSRKTKKINNNNNLHTDIPCPISKRVHNTRTSSSPNDRES